MTFDAPSPGIDVLIATYNSANHIADCLDSLSLITGPWQLIVSDNNSSDNTVAIVKKTIPSAIVLQNSANLGFGQAVNTGLAATSNSVILVLNPDAQLAADPTALAKVVRDEDVILSGLMTGTTGALRSNAFQFPRWSTLIRASKANIPAEELLQRFKSSSRINVDYLEGSFFMIRRETMMKLNGFSDAYFMYGEDRDLSRRALAAGVHTQLADRVSHRHDGGFTPHRQGWYVQGLVTYFDEYLPNRLWLARTILRAKFIVKLCAALSSRNSGAVAAARGALSALRRRK